MLNDLLHSIIVWITAHPGLSTLVVFTIVFLETFAVVGIFIPGAAIMPSIGALIGTSVIPLYPTLIVTFIAGCIGDNLSYTIGRHFHQRIHAYWPFNRYPHWFKNAKQFMHAHGRKSIFWGRFFGPLRAMLPLLAGMMDMRWKRFFIADTCSSLLWTVFYLMPGVLIGLLSPFLPKQFQEHIVILVVLMIILLWACSMIPLYLLKRRKYR